MKSQLIAIVAAVLLAGGGESQESSAPEAQPVEPVAEVQLVEPVAEAAQPEPPLVKLEAPDISIQDAIKEGDIQAVMQHLAAGTDVNAKDENGVTPLHWTKTEEIAELLIAKGADVNARTGSGETPLDLAIKYKNTGYVVDLLRKNTEARRVKN